MEAQELALRRVQHLVPTKATVANALCEKESVTMVKNLLRFVFLTMILSAIAVSASQLGKSSSGLVTCGNPCTSSAQCARPCGCLLRPQGGGVCRL